MGGTGKLGEKLSDIFIGSLAPPKRDLNITDMKSVTKYLFANKERYHTIINCAAMTDTKLAEEVPSLAYDINSIGVFNLAISSHLYGKKFVQISTDHVFDGTKGNYKEEDLPNPQGHYAKSKYAGELFAAVNPKHLVIRTSFMEEFPHKGAFYDKFWSGMWIEDAAREIAKAIAMNLRGTFHIAGLRKSIYEFVKERYDVTPISAEGRIARCGLPYLKDTSLNTEKWQYVCKSGQWIHQLSDG